MYIINKETNRIEKIESTTFKQLGFKEREHLQEWIANNPSCLNEDLLIIQKEFDGFYDTSERLDLLAIDKQGNIRRKFWTAYLKEINKATSLYQNVSPGKDHWISAGSGISGVTFTSVVTGDYIRIELSIHGKTQEENKAIFDALENQKDKIEAAFGNPLEWERLSDKRMSRIKYQLSGVSVFNEEDWNKMFEFMVQHVPKFEAAFKKPIQLLSRK